MFIIKIFYITANGVIKTNGLVYGVSPILFDDEKEKDKLLSIVKIRCARGILEEDPVLFKAGFRTHKKHANNIIVVPTLNELLEYTQKTVRFQQNNTRELKREYPLIVFFDYSFTYKN